LEETDYYTAARLPQHGKLPVGSGKEPIWEPGERIGRNLGLGLKELRHVAEFVVAHRDQL
jgi:hypothetical protein